MVFMQKIFFGDAQPYKKQPGNLPLKQQMKQLNTEQKINKELKQIDANDKTVQIGPRKGRGKNSRWM